MAPIFFMYFLTHLRRTLFGCLASDSLRQDAINGTHAALRPKGQCFPVSPADREPADRSRAAARNVQKPVVCTSAILCNWATTPEQPLASLQNGSPGQDIGAFGMQAPEVECNFVEHLRLLPANTLDKPTELSA